MQISRVLCQCLDRQRYPIPNSPFVRHMSPDSPSCHRASMPPAVPTRHTATVPIARAGVPAFLPARVMTAGKTGGSGGFGIY